MEVFSCRTLIQDTLDKTWLLNQVFTPYLNESPKKDAESWILIGYRRPNLFTVCVVKLDSRKIEVYFILYLSMIDGLSKKIKYRKTTVNEPILWSEKTINMNQLVLNP